MGKEEAQQNLIHGTIYARPLLTFQELSVFSHQFLVFCKVLKSKDFSKLDRFDAFLKVQ